MVSDIHDICILKKSRLSDNDNNNKNDFITM